ncbi:MAG TPA: 3-hydroxyacyl-CoA dehydrogenase family protein [Chloroflexota bacterium]|nr:3-hydroxyacyl-CoA dehydrogenase family protein [Chloroflexota bacterium]
MAAVLGRHVAVVGAGFMGGGIAAELALCVAGLESVRVWDAAPGAAAGAVGRAPEVARILVEAGVLPAAEGEARLARLVCPASLRETLEGVDYVAEAVPEDLALKQEVFRELDALAPPEAVLASNTSGYDPAALAQGLGHAERVLVAHYFGPAYLIPLVEVVPHAGTAGWAVERTLALLEGAGKLPVRLGKFVPGFVANRLQQALFREALALVRDGIASPEAVDEVVRWSFGPRLAALGPFTVADFAGLDVYASLATNVWPTLSAEPAAAGPPPELAARVDAGTLGVKSGAGFFQWPAERLQRALASRDAALVQALRRRSRP